MAERYTGLPSALRKAVFERDNFRCRWCGAVNPQFGGFDIHHIEYRRGYSYDVLNNLVTLCRLCHGWVHDSYEIPKAEAQAALFRVISEDGQGTTGMATWRAARRQDAQTDERPTNGVGRLIHID